MESLTSLFRRGSLDPETEKNNQLIELAKANAEKAEKIISDKVGYGKEIEIRRKFVAALNGGGAVKQAEIQKEYAKYHRGAVLSMDSTVLQIEINDCLKKVSKAQVDLLESLKNQKFLGGKSFDDRIDDLERKISKEQVELARAKLEIEERLQNNYRAESSETGERSDILKMREIAKALGERIDRMQQVLRMKDPSIS
jgi:DNA-directed RNA polymerase beta' subunit